MKAITFTQASYLPRLSAEILAAVPALAPTVNAQGQQVATFLLAGTPTTVTVGVPDAFDPAPLAPVLAAHDPTPPAPPASPNYGADLLSDDQIQAQAAAVVGNLRQYIGLATPTAVQRKAYEDTIARVAIYLIRNRFPSL